MLILASQSPRRRELLAQLGVSFTTLPADIDETVMTAELPDAYVARLAEQKAAAVRQQVAVSDWVLGSDTAVVIDGQILGKPADEAEFRSMMLRLSGKQHQVLTAVALIGQTGTTLKVVTTDVTFDVLTDAQIHWYWQTSEPKDKAGGYGIQGLGGQFVKHINGSYSAVVGLPLCETRQLLEQAGVELYEC
ncbi:Maf family protein [Aestuariibacter halophilus]|uniref:dTTP/UTP pyrophosphatase n=1 Tax=Fluctibacter halophilus TaxID=226011 RepID=A0ABS8GAT5_9ALTE|nr:Maf family protein [Aestuariibacter halophilus]MCC2617652.1 Maf family protein [Aestuariibacter halophilus]